MDAKIARLLAGLNQLQAAELVGCSRASIINWETGDRVPSLENARKLARAYGVKLEELEFKGEKE